MPSGQRCLLGSSCMVRHTVSASLWLSQQCLTIGLNLKNIVRLASSTKTRLSAACKMTRELSEWMFKPCTIFECLLMHCALHACLYCMQCCGMPNTGNCLGVCHHLMLLIQMWHVAMLVRFLRSCNLANNANARRNSGCAVVAMALWGSCGYCCVVAAEW